MERSGCLQGLSVRVLSVLVICASVCWCLSACGSQDQDGESVAGAPTPEALVARLEEAAAANSLEGIARCALPEQLPLVTYHNMLNAEARSQLRTLIQNLDYDPRIWTDERFATLTTYEEAYRRYLQEQEIAAAAVPVDPTTMERATALTLPNRLYGAVDHFRRARDLSKLLFMTTLPNDYIDETTEACAELRDLVKEHETASVTSVSLHEPLRLVQQGGRWYLDYFILHELTCRPPR